MRSVSQLLLTFLLNACWQIALVTVSAVLCAWLLRATSARHKHWLWVAALAIALCLPTLTIARLSGVSLFRSPWGRPNTVTTNNLSSSPVPQLRSSDAALAAPVVATATKPAIPLNKNVAAVLADDQAADPCCEARGELLHGGIDAHEAAAVAGFNA